QLRGPLPGTVAPRDLRHRDVARAPRRVPQRDPTVPLLTGDGPAVLHVTALLGVDAVAQRGPAFREERGHEERLDRRARLVRLGQAVPGRTAADPHARGGQDLARARIRHDQVAALGAGPLDRVTERFVRDLL